MSDRDVQREIEANERRARDEQDVGIDEGALRQRDSDGTFLDDLVGGLPGNDDEAERRETQPDSDEHDSRKPE